MSGMKIEIGLDGNSRIGINLTGDENLLFAMMGALDYAKAALADRIRQRNGTLQWGKPGSVPPPPEAGSPQRIEVKGEDGYHTEQKVTRDKAIEATEYAIACLTQRLETMKESPSNATFTIDPDLLSRL